MSPVHRQDEEEICEKSNSKNNKSKLIGKNECMMHEEGESDVHVTCEIEDIDGYKVMGVRYN